MFSLVEASHWLCNKTQAGSFTFLLFYVDNDNIIVNYRFDIYFLSFLSTFIIPLDVEAVQGIQTKSFFGL